MGKIIVVASGKGGTGKTTTTAALASCLAVMGSTVLCVDADAGMRNLDLCLGMSDRAVMDFGDALHGRCGLEDAVAPHPDVPRLFFLPAPLAPLTEEEQHGFVRMVRFAGTIFDYVFIDAPAGIGPGFQAAGEAADQALIVSSADPSSCRDSARAVAELHALGIRNVRLIVNRVRRSILIGTKQTLDDAVDLIGARLLGYVPEDRHVLLAAGAQRPLVLSKSSSALDAYRRIAGRITGDKIPIPF
jgi:septum site-determining protein MinD